VAEQREGAVADQVHRRFVAGDEQQDARGEQRVLAELVACLFGGARTLVLDEAADGRPESFVLDEAGGPE